MEESGQMVFKQTPKPLQCSTEIAGFGFDFERGAHALLIHWQCGFLRHLEALRRQAASQGTHCVTPERRRGYGTLSEDLVLYDASGLSTGKR